MLEIFENGIHYWEFKAVRKQNIICKGRTVWEQGQIYWLSRQMVD